MQGRWWQTNVVQRASFHTQKKTVQNQWFKLNRASYETHKNIVQHQCFKQGKLTKTKKTMQHQCLNASKNKQRQCKTNMLNKTGFQEPEKTMQNQCFTKDCSVEWSLLIAFPFDLTRSLGPWPLRHAPADVEWPVEWERVFDCVCLRVCVSVCLCALFGAKACARAPARPVLRAGRPAAGVGKVELCSKQARRHF